MRTQFSLLWLLGSMWSNSVTWMRQASEEVVGLGADVEEAKVVEVVLDNDGDEAVELEGIGIFMLVGDCVDAAELVVAEGPVFLMTLFLFSEQVQVVALDLAPNKVILGWKFLSLSRS